MIKANKQTKEVKMKTHKMEMLMERDKTAMTQNVPVLKKTTRRAPVLVILGPLSTLSHHWIPRGKQYSTYIYGPLLHSMQYKNKMAVRRGDCYCLPNTCPCEKSRF